MKKVLLAICVFILGLGIVSAETINIKLVYKEAIISRGYIRHNIRNGEEILKRIEIYFNNVRKNKDKQKLETLLQKTDDALTKLESKNRLNRIEKKAFELIKNLYYRSYIELQRKY